MSEENKIIKISVLVSCACVLQIMESLIPHPIPGMRLGLANAITLIALMSFGFRTAMEVTFLRTIVSSLILGTFLSPAFAMSFGGGLASVFVMGGMYRLFRGAFSLIGISVMGALAHMFAQFAIVYFLLGQHIGIFWLLPVLTISSLLTGFLNGWIANFIQHYAEIGEAGSEIGNCPGEMDCTGDSFFSSYIPGNSVIHHIPSTAKIIAVVSLSMSMLFTKSLSVYAGLAIFFAIVILLSGLPLTSMIKGKKIFFWIILFTFVLHTFFTPGNPIFKIGFLSVVKEGFYNAVAISFRLFLFMIIASILLATTSLPELTEGLIKLLSFLRVFGISSEKMAAELGLSLQMVPVFWSDTQRIIKSHKFKQDWNKLGNFLIQLGSLVAAIYQQMELRSHQMETQGNFYQNLIKGEVK